MWRKEREVGNKEARLSTLRLHPSVTDWQLSPCRDEPLAPAPCGVSTSHSVLSNCAPWDTQWPHLTSSGCRLFCLSFLSSARNLFSLAIFFLWHLLLNTSNHVRIGFSGKISQEGLGNFHCLFSHLLLSSYVCTSYIWSLKEDHVKFKNYEW